ACRLRIYQDAGPNFGDEVVPTAPPQFQLWEICLGFDDSLAPHRAEDFHVFYALGNPATLHPLGDPTSFDALGNPAALHTLGDTASFYHGKDSYLVASHIVDIGILQIGEIDRETMSVAVQRRLIGDNKAMVRRLNEPAYLARCLEHLSLVD